MMRGAGDCHAPCARAAGPSAARARRRRLRHHELVLQLYFMFRAPPSLLGAITTWAQLGRPIGVVPFSLSRLYVRPTAASLPCPQATPDTVRSDPIRGSDTVRSDPIRGSDSSVPGRPCHPFWTRI